MKWPLVCLGDLCQINIGRTPSRSVPTYWEGGDQPWLSISDMGRSKEIRETKEGITDKAVTDCNMRPVQAGTILFSFKLSIGKVGIAAVPLFTNEAIASLPILDNRLICEEYLFHALQQVSGRLVGDRAAMGITLNKASLAQIELPLPPLEEQRRIAAILDKGSQILIASRKADELRQLLLERVFTSMFGDPRENPIGWPKLAIDELTSDYVGGAALVPEDFEDEGVPVLHKGAIKPGGRIEADSRKKGFVSHQTAQHYQRCLAGPGRIAVTLRDLVPSGPFIGLMADLSTTGFPEYLLAQGAYAFKVDTRRLLPDYLIALVNMPNFRLVLRQNAVGSTQIHIRLPIFKSIEIPVPPIESQLEFAQVINRISSLNTLSRRQVHHVDELTRSLHGSYF